MSHQLNSVVLFSFLWLLWIEQLYELVESWLVKSSTVQFSPIFCNCANREHNEALQAFLDKELIHQNIHLMRKTPVAVIYIYIYFLYYN